MSDIKLQRAGNLGTVDTDNSSTANLGISGVFTGSFIDVLDFVHITVLVKSNVASATNGLELQFSSDAATVDDSDVFTIPANTSKIFTVGPNARYFRIKYTNGTTAQSSFLLHVILKKIQQKASTHRINDTISSEDDATLIKAILSGEDNANVGTFINIKTDSDGRLLTSPLLSTPEDATEVIKNAQSDISAAADTIFTITNGKTLTITRLQCGAESNAVGGSKVDLFEDPNGDLSVLNLIAALYVNGSSSEEAIVEQFTGDGTRRIVMRRDVFAGAAREVFARWTGFEE